MLSEDQYQKLRLALSSSGWNDVIRPALVARANQAIKTLVLSPAERLGEFKDADDAALRGIIRECEWMLTVWQNECSVYEHNRRLDELERAADGTIPTGAAPNP